MLYLEDIFSRLKALASFIPCSLSPSLSLSLNCKAFLKFCCKLGSKNSFESVLPELLLEYIYLTTIINVFDHFEFEYINKEQISNIVEPVIIYKALTDKETVDIESYKSNKEVLFDFKRKHNLPLFEE